MKFAATITHRSKPWTFTAHVDTDTAPESIDGVLTFPATLRIDGAGIPCRWVLSGAQGHLEAIDRAVGREIAGEIRHLTTALVLQRKLLGQAHRLGVNDHLLVRMMNVSAWFGSPSEPGRWYIFGAASALRVLERIDVGDRLSSIEVIERLERELGAELPRLYRHQLAAVPKARGLELLLVDRNGIPTLLRSPRLAMREYAGVHLPVAPGLDDEAELVDPEDPLAEGFGYVVHLVEAWDTAVSRGKMLRPPEVPMP